MQCGTFGPGHSHALGAPKVSAPGEDRTHDLQMALSCVIMRLTRYLLRYRGGVFSQHHDRENPETNLDMIKN